MVISLQEHNGGVIIDKPPHNMTAIVLSKQTIDYSVRHLRFKVSIIFYRCGPSCQFLSRSDQLPTLVVNVVTFQTQLQGEICGVIAPAPPIFMSRFN